MDISLAPESKPKIRVLLVEDQISIRQMLAAAIRSMPQFEVVGEAGDMEEALPQAVRLQPDVVILDWIFPGGGGAEFLRAMQLHRVHGHVLVMSADTDETSIREALTNGAKGYIEKMANLEEFMCALRAIAMGGAYFGPVVSGVVERLLKHPVQPKRTPALAPVETFGAPTS